MGYYVIRQAPSQAIPPGVRPAFGQLPTIPATIPGCEPCPVGYIGCRPHCVADPAYVPPGMPGAPSIPPGVPEPPAQCPPGTTWAPGLWQCIPFPPGVEPEPPNGAAAQAACVQRGGSYDPARGCIMPAPAPNGAPVPAAVGPPSWWGERSDLEKGLMVGGSALLAVGLIYAVAG